MYIWIGLVFDKKIEEYIRAICRRVNKGILSEQSFSLPQHISLKTSFYSEKYLEVIDYLKNILSDKDSFDVEINGITKINNAVIWLDIAETKELRDLHNLLNGKLAEKYNILQQGFDGDNFCFHSTLFQDNKINDEHEIIIKLLKNNIKLPLKTHITEINFGISENGKVGTYKVIDSLKFKS